MIASPILNLLRSFSFFRDDLERRFLLQDDYEQLVAMKHMMHRGPRNARSGLQCFDEPSVVDTKDPSTARVPPTPHSETCKSAINRFFCPSKGSKVIVMHKVWCKWLEDCASGRILCCIDAKIQSYARATLLNAFCNYPNGIIFSNENDADRNFRNQNRKCPYYVDMMILINPESPPRKCPQEYLDTAGRKLTKNPNSAAEELF
ncbi:hypothetical protein LOK49_LG13G02173 [Camellia lanceoleosa]|uniref:Uncharacterized protein n=1 Tax=Camellia lanceoleosa TaxID=1840588 RepID=A0ACC0FNT1_9ERIC|nr:hypothetical protein LOK49_LG13G02173 [Camellia lanceoleosa]